MFGGKTSHNDIENIRNNVNKIEILMQEIQNATKSIFENDNEILRIMKIPSLIGGTTDAETIENLRKTIAELQTENENLQRQIPERKRWFAPRSKDEVLEQTRAKLQKQIDDLKQENSTQKNRITELNKTVRDQDILDRRHEQMSEQSEHNKQKALKLEADLKEYRKMYDEKIQENVIQSRKLTKEITDKTAEITKLTAAKNSLTLERDALKYNKQDNIEKIKKLNEEIKNHDKLVKEWRKEITAANHNLAKSTKKNEQLINNIKELEDDALRLLAENRFVTEELTKKSDRVNELQAENVKLSDKIVENEAKINKLNDTVLEQTKKISLLENLSANDLGKIKDLMNQLEQSLTTNVDLSNRINNLNEKINVLENSVPPSLIQYYETRIQLLKRQKQKLLDQTNN